MLLLVGLGNPGAKYAGNRHNIGFMAVEEIAERHNFSRWRQDFHGLTSEGTIADIKTLLLLPRTFMNESGRAVAAAMSFHKISLDRITVFHDEIDLHPAYVKIKIGGGNAGHNGLRSITVSIGNDYRRVCIGVGRPPPAETVDHSPPETVEHYVLRNFENSEDRWVAALLEIISDKVDLLVRDEGKRFEDEIRHDMIVRGFKEMLSHQRSRPKR
jgi:peptidyl-tRNA hydrolase, PTH1 family